MADTTKNNRPSIEVSPRKSLGKKNRALRRSGFVPVAIYGPAQPTILAQAQFSQLEKLLRDISSSSLIEVKLGQKEYLSFVQEVQRDPRNDKLIHISFLTPKPDKPVRVHVPIKIKGISPAVKNNLGILVTALDEIPVRGLPKDIPQHITVDISRLEKVGDTITLKEIDLPEGLSFDTQELGETVITIIAFQKEEVVEETTEEPEEGAAEGEAAEADSADKGEKSEESSAESAENKEGESKE